MLADLYARVFKQAPIWPKKIYRYQEVLKNGLIQETAESWKWATDSRTPSLLHETELLTHRKDLEVKMVPGEDMVSFVLRRNMLLWTYLSQEYCGEHYDGLPRGPLRNE